MSEDDNEPVDIERIQSELRDGLDKAKRLVDEAKSLLTEEVHAAAS